MGKLKRYNPDKRGSFQISLDFFDWELSIIIGSLRATKLAYKSKALAGTKISEAYVTFLNRLEGKFSRALGDVLKAEFRDLKVTKTKRLTEKD